MSRCSNNKSSLDRKSGKVLLLSDDKITRIIFASAFIESLDYVFLSTQPNSIIAQVSDLLIIHDTIVILDKKLNSILTFSINGHFIKKIISSNDLPNAKIISMAPYKDGILININKDSYALNINIKGQVISKISTQPYKALFGAVDGNSFWSFFPFVNLKFNDNNYFQISNGDGQIKHRFIQPLRDCLTLTYVPRTFSYTINGISYLFTAETNCIYKILKDDVLPTYSFAYDKTPSVFHIQPDIFEIDRVVESDDYIFINALTQRLLRNYIYIKDKDSIFSIPRISNSLSHIWGINNDIDGVYPVWPDFRVDDNKLARVVMSKDIKNFQSQNAVCEGQQAIRNDSVLSLIKDRHLIDNPIIILYHLRYEKETAMD
jgi:hypothetical protein